MSQAIPLRNLYSGCDDIVRAHSDLGRFTDAIGPAVRQFHWLINDWDVVDSDWQHAAAGSFRLLTASELVDSALVRRQVIWAAISAIPHEVQLLDIDMSTLPLTGECPGDMPDEGLEIWSAFRHPQHPQAAFEIICFDSSATLLIDQSGQMHERFQIAYPNAKPIPDDLG